MRKTTVIVGALLIAMLVGVPPVAADTSLSEVGEIGPHHLIDTIDGPAIACTFEQLVSGSQWWTLTKISVKPPVMKGTRDGQVVAWRFLVERMDAWYDREVTYRSQLRRGTADLDTPAHFTRKSVRVDVPADGADYYYRVQIVMLWYRSNGHLAGKSIHRTDFYRSSPPDYNFAGRGCSTSRPTNP